MRKSNGFLPLLTLALIGIPGVTHAVENIGNGQLHSVVPVDQACIFDDDQPLTAVESWDVMAGRTYQITLTAITEVSGPSIGVIVHSASSGNFATTATQQADGSYQFQFRVPSDGCLTMPIEYGAIGLQPGHGWFAERSDDGDKESHLRVSTFDGQCNFQSEVSTCSGPIDYCAGVTCVTPPECYSGPGTCDPTTGLCVYSTVSTGASCTDDGHACTSDLCGSDGTCHHDLTVGVTCRASTGVCDVAEVCCAASLDCPADSVADSSVQCRAASGSCDLPAFCDGTSKTCPSNPLQPPTTVCRPAAGPCDTPELCTGTSAGCPSDLLQGPDTVCRCAAGVCDIAEVCTGFSAQCPNDSFVPSSTMCRASAGSCDVAEFCTGSSADCPSDSLQPPTVVCRGSAGTCDLAENCTGSSVSCPPDQKSTATCRASAGICDVAEVCDGVSNDCPPDQFQSGSTVCRGAAGSCDIAENCTGSSADCPADAKSTGVCHAAAGVCDVAESCNGVSNDCPTDQFLPSSTVCNASTGPCETSAYCTGSAASCPNKSFKSSTTVCRPAANPCDAAEACTGSSAQCPADTCNICVDKFYDGDANGGSADSADSLLAGWPVYASNGSSCVAQTTTSTGAPAHINPPLGGKFTVCEGTTSDAGWHESAVDYDGVSFTPTILNRGCVKVDCSSTAPQQVDFLNYCLVGDSAARTIGFWSNKNGGAIESQHPEWAAVLNGLDLRNGDGSLFIVNFSTKSGVSAFQSWILSATGTNMASMLSAQAAAFQLNVLAGYISGSAQIFAATTVGGVTVKSPCTIASGSSFCTVNAFLADIAAQLAGNAVVLSGSADRNQAEAEKDICDAANNSQDVFQSNGPCKLPTFNMPVCSFSLYLGNTGN